ncbi:MAG: hypothetical protein H7Z17_18490 [Fuerstia sp.]|nr:hypothetical protein [Fuerstiella sp.]
MVSSIPALDIGSTPFALPPSEALESDDSVSAPDIDITPVAAPASEASDSIGSASAPNIAVVHAVSTDPVSHKLFAGVTGYAIVLTLFLLELLYSGRVSLFGYHALESLPDLRPLPPNEFRRVPDGAELPDGHVLRLGESRRFGDVVVTPVRVTKEPLQFQGFLSGTIEKKLTTEPVLKLWLTFENVADDYAFPPFDAGLMSSRTPADSQDAATIANSFLTIGIPSGDSATTRRLNYLHSMDNNFVIVGQESAKSLLPGESLTTFVAASEEEDDVNAEASTPFVWRVQFRKGVNLSGGNGVTTLIDVKFSGADVAASG